MVRWLGMVLGLLVVLTTPAHSAASPTYPAVLQHTLDLPCPPTCLVCHTQIEGGPATANTKVGVNLRRMFHAECCDDRALEHIIAQLDAADLDSDGDGISDVAELQMSSDPNQADNTQMLACAPKSKSESQGCSLSQNAEGSDLFAGAFLLLLLVAIYRRASALS